MQEDDAWYEVDFADVFVRIERHFAVQIPIERWDEFLGAAAKSEDEWLTDIKPWLTFGRMADLIAEYTEAVSFEPVTICFRECAPAGAFLGIQRLYEQWRGFHRMKRFAPSTAIRSVLTRDKLADFWCQLRWQSTGRIQELEFPYATLGCSLLAGGLLLLAGGTFCAVKFANPKLFVFGLWIGAACLFLGQRLRWAGNPLPEGIVTFRDAAERIASGSGAQTVNTG